MLAAFSMWNLVNTSADYSLVFTEGTEQAGQSLQPSEGAVILPGMNYGNSVFETYMIDVRSDAGDAATSIGTASVITVHPSGGDPYLSDQNGLLKFEWSESYSSDVTYKPYYISGQLVTVILPLWGWNNDSPYDLEITDVSGANSSPAVGTVIESGQGLGGIMGSGFEFDILAAGTTDVLGHSSIAVGPNNSYLYDTANLTTFTYNRTDSAASGYTENWQDLTIDLAPPVISNDGWTSGMGNTSAAATPGQSFWAIDYGSEEGRWTISDGAAFQSNTPIAYDGGENYGSRAYPVTLDANYQASYGPGAGYDGLWQMDVKIGSTGSADNSFVETFYLAERFDPRVGADYYADGSPAGGPAGWSREIDIMETRWDSGGLVGPQVNLPTGLGGGNTVFTGWTHDDTYQDAVLGEWDQVGGAPTEQFVTFGILIRDDSLWIYAYKPDGSLWYSTDEIPLDSDYQQTAPFVPYIGTWGPLGDATIDDRFETGYKNFVYLPADSQLIATANPVDNPNAFGPALVSATQSGELAFSDLATIADSLRLAEDDLPQVPGLDVSPAQMLPARLSDILALEVTGNGQTTWSEFDSTYPSPSVGDVQSVANEIAAGSSWPTVVLPTTSGVSISAGNALQSSTAQPQFAQLPDLQLGAFDGFTVQAWVSTSDLASGGQRIIDLGAAEDADANNITLFLDNTGLLTLGLGGSTYASTTPLVSDAWHHVSAAVDGTTAMLFIDGVRSDTFTVVAATDTPRANNWWGYSNTAGDPVWQGQQDELRIWSRALSATEIEANYKVSLEGTHAGLVAYYRANDTSGSDLVDSSGNGNTATRMTLDAQGDVMASTTVTASMLQSLVVQNGAVVSWSPSQTYQAVFSTGSVDEVLKLRRGPTATIPVEASGNLQLTLALDDGGHLLTGVSASWSATSNQTNLSIDAGLGYLDTTIIDGAYTVDATASAYLKSPNGSTASPGGTSATSTTVTSLTLTEPSASYFPGSGSISVAADMPFAGEVGGMPLPSGDLAPKVSLPSAAGNWTTQTAYVQPHWTLANMGEYLSLAQLDVAALVATGLQNTGGSLAGLENASWLTVPFSSDVIAYDWGTGLETRASLLTESVLALPAFSRVSGWTPENNYGATFGITRGATETLVDLLGNLTTDAPAVDGASPLLAAPLAAHFASKLAGTGLSCREVAGRPGLLEFYATDETITGFTMTPLNPTSGAYPIGSRSANAFAALGFFAEQTASLQLTNGSFEGPYAGTAATPYAFNPSGGEWVFEGTSGLARDGSVWYLPAAPEGQQAAFLEGPSSITQTIYDLAAGTYQLSFSAIQRSDVTANGITVLVDGDPVLSVAAEEIGALAWKQFSTPTFTVEEGTHTISFAGLGAATDASALDAVVLYSNLTAEVSTAPTFATFRGLLERLNQQNLIGEAASPVTLPSLDTVAGQVAIAAGSTFSAATMPAAVQFVASVPGHAVTPLVFAVTGSGASATYTLVAAGRSIDVARSGLQTWPLVVPDFVPSDSATYVLGFTDRTMSVAADTISTVASTTGTIGFDSAASGGTWLATGGTLDSSTGASLVLGATFGESSGTLLTSGRNYALASFTGLAQAGSGSVSRPEIDTAAEGIAAFTGAAYTTACVPTGVRFYAAATGTLTPLLLAYTSGDDFSVAAVGEAIAVTATGLNEHPLFFPTLGSLTPGATYLFGFQNQGGGIVSVHSGDSASTGWIAAAADAAVLAGDTATFSAAGVRSVDVISSVASGSAVAAANAAVYDTTLGGVVIDGGMAFSAARLPTAMQVEVLLPDGSDSASITPLLFAVGGTEAAPTYSLVGAATSKQVVASGVAQLPVELSPSLRAGLSPGGTYAMGFSTIGVQIATDGSITPTAAFTGIVGRAASTAGGRWLSSGELGTSLRVGDVLAASVSGSQLPVTAGMTYACTFLAEATQDVSQSGLASVQYAGGLAIDVSYADLSSATGQTEIEAAAIATLSVGGVSGLSLSGAEDVPMAITATRQFSLSLDASVMTTGATLANQQQQASALPITTGVLSAASVSASSQRFGVDGYLSEVINVSAGTQVYTTAPSVMISDATGSGSGATAVAVLDPTTGTLRGISLLTPGSGYTTPVVTVIGNNNPATVAARWSGGVVTGGVVVDGGASYAVAPVVTITDESGTGTGATATATLSDGVVTGIEITSGGSGYGRPRITIAPPTVATASTLALTPVPTATVVDATGAGATATVLTDATGKITGISLGSFQATADATASNGVVTSVALTAGGATYSSLTPPTVTIIDSQGSGSGAVATAAVSADGSVTAITLTDGGTGYVNPVVVIGPPATHNSGYTSPTIEFSIPGLPDFNAPATASAAVSGGGVTGITVTNGSQFYGSFAPSVTITGGGGTGATATATVFNGVVTAIEVNSAGSGYTSAPTVEVAAPLTAGATVTDGVQAAMITSPGVLYQATPSVTITDSVGSGEGAAAYAVLEAGRIVDLVFTSYGSGYVSPVITIDAPWVDISVAPQGPSEIDHTFYFLDGGTWSTTTSSESGISLQYQLIDQLTELADAAARGLETDGGSSSPGAYSLQAYLAPLLTEDSPTTARAENLTFVMPTASNAPLVWYLSARSNDSLVGQALFPASAWSVATVGEVTLGNIDLAMNLVGTSGSPGFTGSAQVGYVDVDLVAETFTPDVMFTLQTNAGVFQSFGAWQSILTNDTLLEANATTTDAIDAYDLTFSASVSDAVQALLGEQFIGTPQLTLSARVGGAGGFVGALTDANWGGAQGLLFVDAADLAPTFEAVAGSLAATDTAGLLASPMPFVSKSLQELTGFSELFTDQIEQDLVTNIPTDLDALLSWAEGTAVFTPAFGAATAGGTSGYALTLNPATNWSQSTSASTEIAIDFETLGTLAGGFPAGQTMLGNVVVLPANTGNLIVSLTASWQAPFGTLLVASDSGTELAYSTAGYIAGSDSTQAWVLTDVDVAGSSLDFQGTLGTMPILFDASASTTAQVSLVGGGLATTLATAGLAASVTDASLSSRVTGGSYSAVLPVYYPTATCYSGQFSVGGVGASAAPLAGFLTPGASASVALELPDITNDAIASLSLADSISNTDVMQSSLGGLADLLAGTFTKAMQGSTQIVVGDGTKAFSAAFSAYDTIADYVAATLPPFVPQCNQNAIASATTTAGVITAITVVQTGESYEAAPAVTITDLAGSGSGATATAVMVDDGNGGLKVASITILSGGTGYVDPIVSVSTPSVGQESADEQLYNETTSTYNVILATPGIVLDGSTPTVIGSYVSSLTGEVTSGSLPVFLDADGNELTYNAAAEYFIDALDNQAVVQSVEFPLVIDYTLASTEIPFDLGMPGIPIGFTNMSMLTLLASGSATVDLTFGIDAYNGFFIVPDAGNQFAGTLSAGPAENFSNAVTVGILSGTMTADVGDIFRMGFATTLSDPDGDGQLTLKELNAVSASSVFQTTLANPVVDLELDLELQVGGGGMAAALPSFAATMAIAWPAGSAQPTLGYQDLSIDLGSFISDYMAPIATRLGPITSGVQPILNALDTQIPVLSDVIGGDTSLLGLANRFGGADLGFVQTVSAIASMVQDITSAVDYMNRNPDESYQVPLGAGVTFANDFRTAASGLSKPLPASKSLPSQGQTVDTINAYLGTYQGASSNSFTTAAKKVVNANSSYGVSGGLGISFDVLSTSALIDMLTGQTTNLFTINFPALAANFSLDASYPIAAPLSMTFGGGVNASVQLGMGMSTAGLEVWSDALQAAVSAGFDSVSGGTSSTDVSFSDFLSPQALESLALDVIEDGLFVDSRTTRIKAGGSLAIGAELNAGAAKGGVTGSFNVDMIMTPNAGADGRLTLGEMIQLAGDNFSSPLNLFDFAFQGSISADAYLKLYLPFKWKTIWSHNFGSFTIFDIENNPAPPTESAASMGSLFLNMGPTAARRGDGTAGVSDEHYEVRHLGGVAGNETLSVQFYVDGVPQYVDGDGNPDPQVYVGVTNIVGLAGGGDDTVDCTGVLSPVEIDGGGGHDTILGGLGVNTLIGGLGNDRLVGGGVLDFLDGGDGRDALTIAGGIARIAAGRGEDSFLHTAATAGDYTFVFEDGFGGDVFDPGLLTGATLDFSRLTKPVSLALGNSNSLSMGGLNGISWTGEGPATILLGAGHDKVAFGEGYAPIELDLGGGRNQLEIGAFVANAAVSILGNDPEADDQVTILETAARGIGLAAGGIVADNGAAFAMDVAQFRKLTVHDSDADVSVDYDGASLEKLHIAARTVAVLSALNGKDLRFIGADGVNVNADVMASRAGSVLLKTVSSGAAVTLGEDAAAAISAVFGNVAVMGDRLSIGSHATTPFTISGGGLENNSGATTVPAGRALIGSVLLGPGGDYSGMHLQCCDLSGVDLSGANLSAANMVECDLTGADLSGTTLTGANLSGATLKGAKLHAANLRGVNLEGAELADARVVGGTAIVGSLGTPASLPAGWRAENDAIVFFGVDVPQGQTQFLSAVHTGNEEIVKTGDGTLVITKANTHAGGTTVMAGTVIVRNINALGTGPLIVASGASVVLDVGFGSVVINALSLAEGAKLTQITPSGHTSSEAAFTLTSDAQWLRLFNDGTQLTTTSFATWSSRVDWKFAVIGDFTGDGLPDVAAMTPSGVWWAGINQGDGTSRSVRMTQWSGSAGWSDVLVGDYNGDGRSDIAGKTAGGGWWVATARTSFPGFTNALFAQWSSRTGWSDTVAGDFNGDGRDDIAGRTASGVWWAAMATASGMAVNTRMGRWAEDTYLNVAAGDVNGDGLADILGRGSDGAWWAAVASSAAPGFTTHLMTRWSAAVDWRDVQFGDIDGNGRTDVVGRATNGQWWAAYARETSLGFDNQPLSAWNRSVDWKNVILGDFDFDGRLDLAGVATSSSADESGRWWASLTKPSGIRNEAWGMFGLDDAVAVRAMLTTSTR